MDATQLNHLEEYKTIRAELKLYQQEMHRTWLWAIIPATAVYTWLASNPNALGDVRGGVWFCPVILIVVCGTRYFGFWCRIERLVEYQCDLEEAAFDKKPKPESEPEQTAKKEQPPESWKLRGIARWHRHSPGIAWPKGLIPLASLVVTILIWVAMLSLSCVLSCKLSCGHPSQQGTPQSHSTNTIATVPLSSNGPPASGTLTSTGAPPSQPISKP